MAKSKKVEYNNPKFVRSKSVVTMEIDVFFINGKQVCYSWWGCEDHPREVCRFLLQRNFGSIDVCGLLGDDLLREYNQPAVVHENCPLKTKEI